LAKRRRPKKLTINQGKTSMRYALNKNKDKEKSENGLCIDYVQSVGIFFKTDRIYNDCRYAMLSIRLRKNKLLNI
jgi:dTDP-D-glucose 4,6-dehydratase